MGNRIRVEITGRNSFWENAVQVEWTHQFPDRKLIDQGNKFFLVEEGWLQDLQRVAHQCFSKAIVAPEDIGKRKLFRTLFRGGDDNET